MVKAGGQEITVTISLGGSGLQVPDLYNKDQRVAVNALNDLGLVPDLPRRNFIILQIIPLPNRKSLVYNNRKDCRLLQSVSGGGYPSCPCGKAGRKSPEAF